MLLQVVDQIDNSLLMPDESQDGEITDVGNDRMLVDDETKEEFLESEETDLATEAAHEDVEDVYDDVDYSHDGEKSIHQESVELTESLEASQTLEDEGNDESQAELDFLEDDENETVIETPPNTSRRKSIRQSNPDGWIRNKRKLAKNTGQSYVASNGKFIEAKQMKANCGNSCRMQCSKKINEENRLKIFEHFYQLADIAKQRKFLFDHMKTYEPKRNKTPKNPQKVRAVQRCYFLNLVYANEDVKELLQVCKLMFLNTFSISSQMIDTLFRKAINDGRFSDTRGKFERKQSRSHEFCVQHITKYPYAQPDQSFSVARLYEKYVKECQLKEVEPLKEPNYLEIYKHFMPFDQLKKALKNDNIQQEHGNRIRSSKESTSSSLKRIKIDKE